MNVRERRTSRDGLRFSHRIIENAAPDFSPTLFVSGAFQSMDSWTRFAQIFAPHTTVLLVDLPGMGESDLLPPEAGVDFLADCLAQVLDEHGVQKATVISSSYGTPPAFMLAAQYPERIDRVVLAGTMKELPSHLRTRIAGTVDLARRLDLEALAVECVDGMLCQDPLAQIDRRDSSARALRSSIVRLTDGQLMKYAANTERLLNHKPLALVPRIHGPEALVFTGEHDVFTPPASCREVAGAFDRVWFTTIRRADHLFPLQQWPAVSDLILRFAARTLRSDEAEGWYELEALNSPIEQPSGEGTPDVDVPGGWGAGAADSTDASAHRGRGSRGTAAPGGPHRSTVRDSTR